MESNFAQRLKKESLEARLARYTKDYQALDRDYQEAGDSDEKNRLQLKLERKLEEIDNIEQELNKINESEQKEQKLKLIKILEYYFNQQLIQIQNAYEISLPKRSIFIEFPNNPEELISNFEFVEQEENSYSYLEKLVCNLWLLSKDMSETIKEDLQTWIKENINNCQELMTELKNEKQEREKRCNPSLWVAINNSGDSYVVEAWLIKNLDQYDRKCYSDCERLKINNKIQIATNANLTNLPEIIKIFIQQSFDKSQK